MTPLPLWAANQNPSWTKCPISGRPCRYILNSLWVTLSKHPPASHCDERGKLCCPLISSAGSRTESGYVWWYSFFRSNGAPSWASRWHTQSSEPAGPGYDRVFRSQEVKSYPKCMSLLCFKDNQFFQTQYISIEYSLPLFSYVDTFTELIAMLLLIKSSTLRSHSNPSNVIFSLSSQMMVRGSSFGIAPAATSPLVTRQGSPSSASLLQSTLPGSPALSHAKAESLGSAPGSPLFRSLSPCHPPLHGSPARASDFSLSSMHVPLEAIRPSKERGERGSKGWWAG